MQIFEVSFVVWMREFEIWKFRAAFENTTRRVFCLSLLWVLHVYDRDKTSSGAVFERVQGWVSLCDELGAGEDGPVLVRLRWVSLI